MLENGVKFLNVAGLVKVVGGNVELGKQGLGVEGHFYLAGHGLADLAPLADKHRQRNAVILNEGCQRINSYAECRVLHHDGGPLASHPRPRTQAHTFILPRGRDVVDCITLIYFFDHARQLLARHRGHKFNPVGDQICDNFFV